jgi:oxygen-independent coproporphyrinogen-3 oxidase
MHCLGLELCTIDDRRAFDTIYFGGGTPGILSPTAVSQIGEMIHKKLKQYPREWTVEIAPNTASREKLRAWRSVGANRLSMGIQSFDESLLRALGRRQSPEQIFRTYEWSRRIGFQNIGLDLIFAIPGQTAAQLIADLSRAISLAPEHISTYCLTYEEGTPLTHRMGDGSEEDRDHDFYEIICDFLGSHGYGQYEISNFCRPGYASIHNRNTWLMQEWIGIGPSASSQYSGMRRSNLASLEGWANGIESKRPIYGDVVKLNEELLAIDEIIFGLRMNEGIDMARNPHRERLSSFFQRLQAEKLLIHERSNVRLTRRGRLVCDAIAWEIFNILT